MSMSKEALANDLVGYVDKAMFRLEVIEDMLEDLGELRLVGEIRGAHRILRSVESSLTERGDE